MQIFSRVFPLMAWRCISPPTEGNWDFWVASHSSLQDEWSTPVALSPPVNSTDIEGFPSVSADGLELYFSRGIDNHGNIFMAKRESINEPWQSRQL